MEATTDDTNGSYLYAKGMAEQLHVDRITSVLQSSGMSETGASQSELFRAGYAVGCLDTYEPMAKKISTMSTMVGTLYKMLGDMANQAEAIEHLQDVNALTSVIAGYLVAEADDTLAATRTKLHRVTGTPVEYISSIVPYTEIPIDVFRELGQKIAMHDHHKFAMFAVSGGRLGPEDALLSVEQLRDGVIEGKWKAEMPPQETWPELYVKYGQRQVRITRRMYSKLEESLNTFREQHEKTASQFADDIIARCKK